MLGCSDGQEEAATGMTGMGKAGFWPPPPSGCQGPSKLAETSIRPPVSPTTKAFWALLAVMDTAPGSTPGNLAAGCPSTGTSHSVVWLPAPASTSRSSASYQVSAIGLRTLGPSCTGGPMDVRTKGLLGWPEAGAPLSIAASWSWGADSVCTMAATRTPSGAMLRPVIFPWKELGIWPWSLLLLLVCTTSVVVSFWVTQR